MARAFVDQKRHVLLFDEPTAHLDIETEVEMKERMLPLMNNHLVFCDTSSALDGRNGLHFSDGKGQLVEQGTLAELIEKDGYYVQLMKQMRGGRQ